MNSLLASLPTVLLLAASNVFMNQPFKLDYLWAGLCLMGAVCFIFRG